MDNLAINERNFLVKYYFRFLKYFEILKISFLTDTTYLSSNFTSGLVVFFRIWIFTQLYQITYATINKTTVSGFTIPMVIWSLMIVQSMASSTRPSIARKIQDEIKEGTIDLKICRPYSFMFFYYFELIGRFISSATVNLLVGFIAVLILVGPIKITIASLIFGLILLIFGIFLDFLTQYIIGLLSFWIEDIQPIIWIYGKGVFILGGMIFPIALFPESFQKVAEFLPFSQLFYSASRTFVSFDYNLFVKYLLTQIVWIIIFYALAAFMYRKGVRNVNINGG